MFFDPWVRLGTGYGCETTSFRMYVCLFVCLFWLSRWRGLVGRPPTLPLPRALHPPTLATHPSTPSWVGRRRRIAPPFVASVKIKRWPRIWLNVSLAFFVRAPFGLDCRRVGSRRLSPQDPKCKSWRREWPKSQVSNYASTASTCSQYVSIPP